MSFRDALNSRIGKPNLSRLVTALAIAGLFVVTIASLQISTAPVAHATAGINKQLNYQGRLLTNGGAVVADGNYNIRFKIYQGGTGTAANNSGVGLMWTEQYQNNTSSEGIVVKNGYFSVALGTYCAFDGSACTGGQSQSNTAIDWNQDTLWLSMDVDTAGTSGGAPTYNGEMLPMKRLTSTVYALNAGLLGGLSSANFVQLAQGVQTDASTTNASIYINKTGATAAILDLRKSNSTVFGIDNTGNITSTGTYNGDTFSSTQLLFAGAATVGSGGGSALTLTNGSGAGSYLLAGTAPVIDTVSAGVLSIGAAAPTATSIKINQNVTFANDKGIVEPATATGNATALQVQTFTGGSSQAFFTVDTTIPRVTVGTGTCTIGRFCVYQTIGSGSATTVNNSNTSILSLTTSGATNSNSVLVLSDTTTHTNTLNGLVIDATGTTTITSSINSFSSQVVASQPGNFLDLVNGTTHVTNITNAGALTLQNASNSSAAFLVKNLAGNSILNVDTTVSGAATISGVAPASVGGAGTAASTILTVTGPAGGATSSTSGVAAGTGSGISLTTGTGGAATGASGGNTGGAGGVFTLQGGNGGAATNGGGGAGGNISIIAGNGGAGTSGGGNGGMITLTGGSVGASGSPTVGGVLVKNASNGTNAFQVQNTLSNTLLNADTTTPNATLGLTNPSFETNTTGWSQRTSCTLTRITSDFVFGGAAAQCADTATNAGLNFNLTLANSTQYTLSFYAKVSASNGTFLNFGYAQDGSTETGALASVNQSITSSWKRYSLTFSTTSTSGTPYIFIKQNDSATRNLIVDGVQIEAASAATASVYREGNLTFDGTVTSQSTFRNQVDTLSGFQVQSSSGQTIFNIDTQFSRIGIGTTSPAARVDLQATTSIPALNISQASSGSILQLQSAATAVLTVSSTGAVLLQNAADSAAAFQVSQLGGKQVLTVDTSGANVVIGKPGASGLTGILQFANSAGSNLVSLQAGASSAAYALTLPTTAPAVSQCLQSDPSTATQLVFGSCSSGTYLAKNAVDTSSFAVTAAGNLYTLTNSSSAIASGVLKLDNGSNTNSTLTVTTSANPTSGQALIFANDTNGTPSGNLIDLQGNSTSKFSVTGGGVAAASTSFTAPSLDATSGALSVGNNNASGITIGKTASNIVTTISGTLVVKPTSGNDSATAFQVQNGAGSSTILNVDTSASRIGINTNAPSADLSFGIATTRTINVLDQTAAATNGSNLTIKAALGNTSGQGGVLTLQGGAGGTTGNGGNVAITAGASGGTGNLNGGNIVLTPGLGNGASGTNGGVSIPYSTGGATANGSTAAFQVLNNGGQIFTVDSNGSHVTVGAVGSCTAPAGRFCINFSATTGSGTSASTNSTVSYSGSTSGATNTSVINYLTDTTTNTNHLNGFFIDATNTTSTGTDINSFQSTVNASQPGTFFKLVTGSTTVAQITNAGAMTLQNAADSTAAFQVKQLGGKQVLTVDTSGANVVIGKPGASGLTGILQFANSAGSNLVSLQAGASSAAYALVLPTTAPSTSQCLQSDPSTATQLIFSSCGSGSGLAKNAVDTSSFAVTTGNLYTFTNSSSAVASGLLKLDNGSNTNSTLIVTTSANPTSGQALIFANDTNGTPSGNLIDLQGNSASKFSVTGGGVAAASTSFTAPSLDATSGALSIGNNNATSITLGKTASNIATTVSGTLLVKPTSGNDSATAFQVQNGAATANLLTVDSTVSGAVTVAGVAPAVSGGAGTAASAIFTVNGPAGGASNSTGSVAAGAGSNIAITTGTGGAQTGASGTNTGGAAGDIILTGAAGGAATSGTGGSGGDITLTAGAGGSGSTLGGRGGNVLLQGGAAGSGGAATAGGVTVQNLANGANAFQIQNAAGETLLGLSSTGEAGNFIADGSAEGTFPGNWLAYGSNSAISQSSSQAFAGSKSVQVDITPAAANSGVKYNVSLTNGQNLTLSFYARIASGTWTDLEYGYGSTVGGDTTCKTSQIVLIGGWTNFNCTIASIAGISGTSYIFIRQSASVIRTFNVDALHMVTGNNIGAYYAGTFNASSTIFTGALNVQSTTYDTNTAFQVQAVDGTSVFGVDTLYKRVGVGIVKPTSLLHVAAVGTGDDLVIIKAGSGLVGKSYLQVIDGNTTTTYLAIDANGLTTFTNKALTGNVVSINDATAGQTTTTLLSVASSGYTTLYTGNVASFTGTSTTGTSNVVNIANNGINGSGTALNVNSTTTGALTAGLAVINASGIYTGGNALSVTGNATTAGTVLNVSGTAITGGAGIKVTGPSGASALSAGLVQIAAAGAYTGTGGLLNVTATTSTAGTLASFTNNTATFTGNLVGLSATGITSGSALSVTGPSGAAALSAGLVQIAAAGAYTGTGGLLNVSAGASTAGTLASFTNNTATFTGNLVGLSSTGITSGSALKVTGPSGAAALSNGLIQISAAGAYTGVGGLLNVLATTSTAGTLASFTNNTASFTGNLVGLSATGITSGSALTVTGPSGAAALSAGLVQIAAAGAYTGTGGLLNVSAAASTAGTLASFTNNTASFTGNLVGLSATGITSGSALKITGPSGAAALSAGLVQLTAAGAYTGTGGLLNLQANAVITGSLASISDTAVMTTTGNLLTLTANAATTATGLLQVNGTGLTTGSAITINAGTGTALSVSSTGSIIDLASATAGNTAIIKIPTKASGTCGTGVAEGLIFQDAGGTQRGHACIDSGTPVLKFFANAFTATSTDVAENYSDVNNNLQPGDLVALASTGSKKAIVKADASNASRILGVVSTSPGILLSGIDDSNGATDLTHPVPVALTGRIPTKVSTENGIIAVGDYLTLSSTPGVAMRASTAGTTIGRALENYTSDGVIGSIEVAAGVGYYPGSAVGGQTGANYIQNGGAAVLSSLNVSGDATVATLAVTGNASIGGTLSVAGTTTVADIVVNGHIITGGAAPVITIQTAAGHNATVTIDGNDTSGTITITTGDPAQGATPAPTAGELANVAFSSAFGKAPRVILTPGDATSAPLQVYPGAKAADHFTLGITGVPQPNKTYTFEYFIVQ